LSHNHAKNLVSPDQAKQKLVDGNHRFVNENYGAKDLSSNRRMTLLKEGQFPFAAVLTCSDSRVPPEILFDQALGDIFVIRTAGNVLDDVSMGSVEYAVDHLHTPLVVVLGHENCGAVIATVEGGDPPGSIGAITAMIAPSVQKVQSMGIAGKELCEMAADVNVGATLSDLRTSPVIKEKIDKGEVALVGAKYLLSSGEVVFFE